MRSLSIVLAAVLVSTANCSCDDEEVHQVQQCDLRTECGDSQIMRHGTCMRERCANDGDCCVGERCSSGGIAGSIP